MSKSKKTEVRLQQEQNQEKVRMNSQSEQEMRSLKQKHPDYVPIYFAKHKAAPSTLKEPTQPFMLFQKDLKIEQAMYRLYQQIDTKGLYFFCLQEVKEKTKYIRIQPGSTIQQIYNRYGRDDFLVLIYGNGEMGMQGLKKMEKCMIILLIVIGSIWAGLYAYKYFVINSSNPDPQGAEQLAQAQIN